MFVLDSLQLVKGPLFFNIAMAACSFLMCHEFYKALEEKGFKPIKILGYLCTLFLIPIGIVSTHTLMMICVTMIPLVVFIGMSISVFSNLKFNIVDIAVTLLGNIYTVFLVGFVCITRAMPMGVFLIFYIICGAWFSDIFAYFIGKLIGKHKFSSISPKKSIEGCIAGVFGTVIFFVVFSLFLNNMNFEDFKIVAKETGSIVQVDDEPIEEKIEEDIKKNDFLLKIIQSNDPSRDYDMQEKLKTYFYSNYPLLIILGILVSIVSQIGDLSASAIKRYTDIKDFSNLMPGHGGMLDRFDSILFVAPIIYFTFYIILNI